MPVLITYSKITAPRQFVHYIPPMETVRTTKSETIVLSLLCGKDPLYLFEPSRKIFALPTREREEKVVICQYL